MRTEARNGGANGLPSSLMPAPPFSPKPPLGFPLKQGIIGTVACVLFITLSAVAQTEHLFKGEVCPGPEKDAALTEKDLTALPCTEPHHKKGARYILTDPEKNTIYQLDGHKKPKTFAGDNVVVVGTLDKATGTIFVEEMFRALPRTVTQAKSVYIDCDACPRGMAAAWLAAFEALTDWRRFDIVPDPKKADLIFLFSANPYLGDYITRDGPDKRPVKVDITYMDVVDPRTGESLWDDCRQWGSLFVSRATKDLIMEFKDLLEIEEIAGKS
jgi:hypothetical protein